MAEDPDLKKFYKETIPNSQDFAFKSTAIPRIERCMENFAACEQRGITNSCKK